ncbi:MAG: transmembrane 220 family protein [Spirochaetota bacterium]
MAKYFRLFFLALAAAYLLFAAAVQYNDPDPLHWMALYGLTAFCCFAALAGRRWTWLLWMLLGMSLTEMLITADGLRAWLALGSQNLLTTPMSAGRPWIEQSREFLGAAINLGIVGYLLRGARR